MVIIRRGGSPGCLLQGRAQIADLDDLHALG
jgi:hypothetical protein